MITRHNSETIKFRDLTFETSLYFIHLKINFKISVKWYIKLKKRLGNQHVPIDDIVNGAQT